MVPIKYQVVGEEEYAFRLEIDSSGEYAVHTGTYTTQKPRSGNLTAQQTADLMAAITALKIPQPHPMPAGANAFESKLVIGEGNDAIVYPFWEGAIEEDAKLRTLVRLLEVI
ncbi:MAG: hypothetical protein KZQ75_05180 [Candidatus Thiodiazotropha sp. (ex Myrtea spinifera)]|nr:hypothetical protein [Candidatus Thiodiazotropha sp. (ex Myrtea spinifera)]MCU7827549.1 hypothetical protein [Candidatus Thiodiazotropha sp. (ex Myrtea sp. 'scaly one' KF741663)]MCU7853033.1 hypothetical protein [Candidatus Thiodiazotropha sp. (ex Monitilora ramsayi)]